MNEKPAEEAVSVAESLSPASPDSSTKAELAHASAKGSARQAVDAVVAGGRVAGQKLADAARATGEGIKEAAVVLGDLNNDGKVDHQDREIAAAEAKEGASTIGKWVAEIMKEIPKHPMVKDAAAGGAIGAIVAVPLPIIGPAIGASLGAIGGVLWSIVARKK